MSTVDRVGEPAAGIDRGWLLRRLVDEIDGVVHAIAVSPDGLKVAFTDGLDVDRADQLSAIVSGLVSLGTGAATATELGVLQYTLLALSEGTIVVMAVADDSSLAAMTRPGCDVGAVAHHLAIMADQIGSAISAMPRTEIAASGVGR